MAWLFIAILFLYFYSFFVVVAIVVVVVVVGLSTWIWLSVEPPGNPPTPACRTIVTIFVTLLLPAASFEGFAYPLCDVWQDNANKWMKMFDTEQQGAAGANCSYPISNISTAPPPPMIPPHTATELCMPCCGLLSASSCCFRFRFLCRSRRSSSSLLLVWPLGANLKIIYNDVTSAYALYNYFCSLSLSLCLFPLLFYHLIIFFIKNRGSA